MKNTQYTIRNIPDSVDKILRLKAKESGASFNQTALEALVAGAGETRLPKRDLSFIVGSLTEKEAKDLDEEPQRQRKIDPRIWK